MCGQRYLSQCAVNNEHVRRHFPIVRFFLMSGICKLTSSVLLLVPVRVRGHILRLLLLLLLAAKELVKELKLGGGVGDHPEEYNSE